MRNEAYIFLCMALCGGVCGMVYDVFRAFRASVKYNAVIILTDIMYWLCAACIIMYSMWQLNNLELRWYEFAGLAIGALLYFLTLGHIVYRIFLSVAEKIIKIIVYIFKIILTLRAFLYKITVIPIMVLCKQIKQLCQRRRQI